MEENYTKNLNVIINGDTEYINKINSYLDTWLMKNNERIKEDNIKLISCFDISKGIKQENILPQYQYILNTSGAKEVKDFLKNNNQENEKKLKIAR